MTHVLVTNDFPPKIGGIQSYLWELWRRLPPGEVVIYTTAHESAAEWDRAQPFRVIRSPHRFLRPTPSLARTIDALADDVDASLVLVDPALPLGFVTRWLRHPYGVVLHGAEVTVPGRTPGIRRLLRDVLRGAQLVVAAGGYPAAEGRRAAGREVPTVEIPPGVDVKRFVPLDPDERAAARERFGLRADSFVVLSVSRLVPRKGMDVLVRATPWLTRDHPHLEVVIAGRGRLDMTLQRRVRRGLLRVRVLDDVADDDLPALYGCADLFVMLCRNRWFGLEQEGFGIVFLEAAAAGLASVAGRSGGSPEAVVHGETGLVVDKPSSVRDAAVAIDSLIADDRRRTAYAMAARERAEVDFTYDRLADRLGEAIDTVSANGGGDRS